MRIFLVEKIFCLALVAKIFHKSRTLHRKIHISQQLLLLSIFVSTNFLFHEFLSQID